MALYAVLIKANMLSSCLLIITAASSIVDTTSLHISPVTKCNPLAFSLLNINVFPEHINNLFHVLSFHI